MPTLTESLAQYWATAHYEDLPAEAIRLAKRFLIDTLAAGVAGAHTDVAGIVLRAARGALEGASGSSVLWGRTATLPALQAGMSGPRQVLEARWGGFFPTYARGIATPEATLAGLGSEFRIARSGMKPYACCRGLHATLDALFDLLRETGADSAASNATFRLRRARPRTRSRRKNFIANSCRR